MSRTPHPERPEEDADVQAALEECRGADDIRIISCDCCGWWSYYNEGSHASCRNPDCEADLTEAIDDAISLADYWNHAPYPCDEDAAEEDEPE